MNAALRLELATSSTFSSPALFSVDPRVRSIEQGLVLGAHIERRDLRVAMCSRAASFPAAARALVLEAPAVAVADGAEKLETPSQQPPKKAPPAPLPQRKANGLIPFVTDNITGGSGASKFVADDGEIVDLTGVLKCATPFKRKNPDDGASKRAKLYDYSAPLAPKEKPKISLGEPVGEVMSWWTVDEAAVNLPRAGECKAVDCSESRDPGKTYCPSCEAKYVWRPTSARTQADRMVARAMKPLREAPSPRARNMARMRAVSAKMLAAAE